MPDVAFCRTLLVGKEGKDVIAHKRALSRAAPSLYPWMTFTNYYGPRFRDAVEDWQKRKNLQVTGRIGPTTHEALEKAKNKDGEPAFDALARKLAKDFCEEFLETPREKIVNAARYWHLHKYEILYSQARPFPVGEPPWYPSRWDCSGFVTSCYYAGGVPDPNRRGYDGQGYTGTLIEHGKSISANELKPGDLVFYGKVWQPKPGFPFGAPTHVAVFVGNGMVISNGSYPMGFYPIRYRTDINQYRSYGI